MERRVCSFCGNEIEPGTGKIYVKVDGTVFNFCKNKCFKNLIELKRIPRRTRWTQPYLREKSTKMSAKEKKVSKRRKGKSTKVVKKKKKKPSEGGKEESEGEKEKKG